MATTTMMETRTSLDVKPVSVTQPSRAISGTTCEHSTAWLNAHHQLAPQRLKAAATKSFQLGSPQKQLSCAGSNGKSHAAEHARKEQHPLAVDLRSGTLYCAGCQEYVRNDPIERFMSAERIALLDAAQIPADGHRAGKRPRVNTAASLSLGGLSTLTTIPARGIRNLGNSCYMSVVLQTFLANPFLRAFYLSDRHNRYGCSRTLAGEACLSCELDLLFSEQYAEDSAPHAPTRFLYSFWRSSHDAAGYAQQDAHEFLISALNLIHLSSPHHHEPIPGGAPCPCIVHSTFAGELRSKITCGRCHHQSETLEPFLDLSLDLRDRKTGQLARTLADCLKSFTLPENLPSVFSCAACGDGVPTATKRLSIKSLPSVLCVQFKRFEITNQAHKIDSPIAYPLTIDMGPYLTDHLDYPASFKPSASTRFALMAVIAHEGTLTQGHYTAYIRGPDDFFAIDDEKVRRAPISEVLAAKAYLVVYSRL
ncbi:hypothetical protein BMF94_0577 [Rhodotorula taiwanensis]|uniref:Ubiquitin carboxyl-terminal hydrolase n=1 Tax=Rhodotorula taiwanensis TaxID=741276 RepID=A0A2S5BHX8_9BASI|nr:hypothetical protein BMF94_0577 [Rhodotorula taiwanensis]